MSDQPDAPLPTFNGQQDAPTFFADAVQGMMVSPQVMKLSFIEHFTSEDEGGKARYVVNIVMPYPQLRALGDLMLRIANETEDQIKKIADVQ